MTVLDAVGLVLIFSHVLGLAAVIGPYLMQLRAHARFDLRTMLVGSFVQLASGLAIVAFSQASEGVDSLRVVTRLVMSVFVIGAVFIAQDRQRRDYSLRTPDRITRLALHCAGASAIAIIVLMVLWP
ncbi:MAG: hypothetical protein ACOH1T_08335 [Microbacteriaceae bacterium]